MTARFSKSTIAVLSLAFAVRLAATLATPVINLDGILYINHAKNLLHGNIAESLACNSGFLPLNSVLIALSSLLLSNWIVAAKTVSLICGWTTLLATYLISRRFFDERICVFILLLFSFIPIMVNSSVEIIRDPVAWMFFTFAVFLFIKNQEKHSSIKLFFCGLFFLLASWARVEFLFLYLASGLFLLVVRSPSKTVVRPLLSLFAPLAIVGLISLSNGALALFVQHLEAPLPINSAHVEGLLERYTNLQQQIKLIAADLTGGGDADLPKNFLPEAANLLWLIAFGMITTHLCEAVFYPYLLLFLMGISSIKVIRADRRQCYLLWMTLIAFILIYAQVLRGWVLEYRWLAPIILSTLVLAGAGIQYLDRFLRKHVHPSPKIAGAIICVLIILPGAAKLLQQRYDHQSIFLSISKTIITEQHGKRTPVHIASTQGTINVRNLVAFYANLALPQMVCSHDDPVFTSTDLADTTSFLASLREKNTMYFFLDETNKSSDKNLQLSHVTKKIGEWQHPDTGKITLYKITPI